MCVCVCVCVCVSLVGVSTVSGWVLIALWLTGMMNIYELHSLAVMFAVLLPFFRYAEEIATVYKQHPAQPFKFLDPP